MSEILTVDDCLICKIVRSIAIFRVIFFFFFSFPSLFFFFFSLERNSPTSFDIEKKGRRAPGHYSWLIFHRGNPRYLIFDISRSRIERIGLRLSPVSLIHFARSFSMRDGISSADDRSTRLRKVRAIRSAMAFFIIRSRYICARKR